MFTIRNPLLELRNLFNLSDDEIIQLSRELDELTPRDRYAVVFGEDENSLYWD